MVCLRQGNPASWSAKDVKAWARASGLPKDAFSGISGQVRASACMHSAKPRWGHSLPSAHHAMQLCVRRWAAGTAGHDVDFDSVRHQSSQRGGEAAEGVGEAAGRYVCGGGGWGWGGMGKATKQAAVRDGRRPGCENAELAQHNGPVPPRHGACISSSGYCSATDDAAVRAAPMQATAPSGASQPPSKLPLSVSDVDVDVDVDGRREDQTPRRMKGKGPAGGAGDDVRPCMDSPMRKSIAANVIKNLSLSAQVPMCDAMWADGRGGTHARTDTWVCT